MAAALVVATAALIGLAVWALHDIPWQEIADGSLAPVVVLEASDGQELVSHGPYQGAYASYDDFPRHLVDAVISAEDRRFEEHFGLDPIGIGRAALNNLKAGTIVEGGSTITQQLVKISYLEQERTFKRKVQEAVIALWLERRLGKREILTRYLNNIYLGAGATGVPAAARVYFNKEVGDLDAGESALLAGLIRAPSQLNPLENPQAARRRAEMVLATMVADGKIDSSVAEEAKRHFAELNPTRPMARSGSWFADWASEAAREIAGPYRGTIRVRTSLDPRLQEIAERVVVQLLESEGAAAGASQAALVAMRPDGGVVAMVGGRDYDESSFNRAVTAQRQPGSAFKLFTYYAALKAGYSLDDIVEDAPIKIDNWEPQNFSNDYLGPVTLAEAFTRSLNAATVWLAQQIGLENVIAAARELGIDAPLGETPSLMLGSYEVNLLDLTGAYASVRAGRAPIEPWGIASFRAEGQPRAFSVGPPKPVETDVRPYQADMVRLLQLVVEQGTGTAAALDGFAAGKTGTSQNFRDAWFIGFTRSLVAGVWVGNDDDAPMREVTGGRLPARIWHDFMAEAMQVLGEEGDAIRPPPSASSGGASIVSADSGLADFAPQGAAADAPAVWRGAACDINACSRRYRSFRAEDCTYQPYGGGARRLCPIPPAAAEAERAAPVQAVGGQQQLLSCNYRACSRYYRSFRPADCSYQPYGGGPRRLCQR
ncbi:PBP1A family penicillin-binding protein [Chelativorans sp. Marseille-P2723]|uniref:PBP1A family penicillin-binding protein n=1 Tax=Chelativorans sp. Marseille-P2723 TaxID=2709133 RepID=UPI0032B26C3C